MPGLIAAGLVSQIHAYISIHLQADQVVSGLALTFLATGISLVLGEGLSKAGTISLLPNFSVPLLEKIPHDSRFSSEKMVEDLINRGKKAFYFSDTGEIIDFIVKEAKNGDVALVMSNGGFDNIHERLLTVLGQHR